MKRLLSVGTCAAALLATPATALADGGPPVVTPYTFGFSGARTWTCSGVHVVATNLVSERETCVVTGEISGFVAGTYVGHPSAYFPPFGELTWTSDLTGAPSTWSRITVTFDADRSAVTLYVLAHYGPPSGSRP